MKIIRDTRIAEAITEVLECSNKPLTARQIFERLPFERLVKELDYRDFGKHFYNAVRRKKYNCIERVNCGDIKQSSCFRLKKKG